MGFILLQESVSLLLQTYYFISTLLYFLMRTYDPNIPWKTVFSVSIKDFGNTGLLESFTWFFVILENFGSKFIRWVVPSRETSFSRKGLIMFIFKMRLEFVAKTFSIWLGDEQTSFFHPYPKLEWNAYDSIRVRNRHPSIFPVDTLTLSF